VGALRALVGRRQKALLLPRLCFPRCARPVGRASRISCAKGSRQDSAWAWLRLPALAATGAVRFRHAVHRHATILRDWAGANRIVRAVASPRGRDAESPRAEVCGNRRVVGVVDDRRRGAADAETDLSIPPHPRGELAARGDLPLRRTPHDLGLLHDVEQPPAVVVARGGTILPHVEVGLRAVGWTLRVEAAAPLAATQQALMRRSASPVLAVWAEEAAPPVQSRLPDCPSSLVSVSGAALAFDAVRQAYSLERSRAARLRAQTALRHPVRGPVRPISTDFPNYPLSVFCCAVDAGRGSRFVAASWAAH
jgi:hypothetical protein